MLGIVNVTTSNAFGALHEPDSDECTSAEAEEQPQEEEERPLPLIKEDPEDGEEAWKVSVVQSAEVVYGLDMWPSMLLPPIPDVPCFTCRARTHLQATCPLTLCTNCRLYGHQERYCQKSM